MQFFKYQANGNDFIIIDNSNNNINLSAKKIKILCDRKFGIGADGLILLELSKGFDYSMRYFNSDGEESSFCGNGSRCLADFAYQKKIFTKRAFFKANNHKYEVIINNNVISIKMKDVSKIINNKDGSVLLDTGSPHIVFFNDFIHNLDIDNLGRNISNSGNFKEEGVNVNFVQINKNSLFVRTYERGVERETLSCGTGVVASAIAAHKKGYIDDIKNISIKTKGGKINVNFNFTNKIYKDIYLSGNVCLVFQGDF